MTINRVYMNAFDTLYTVVYIWAFDTLYSAYKDVWHTIQCSMQLATRKNREISSIFHELILEEYMKDQAAPHGRIAAGGAMPPRQVFVHGIDKTVSVSSEQIVKSRKTARCRDSLHIERLRLSVSQVSIPCETVAKASGNCG